MSRLAPLDIGENWGRLNETIVGLVDYIPDDKLDWSPSPELFNFRGILLHISLVRHNWLANRIQDGEETPDVLHSGGKKEQIVEQLRVSWQRVERFLSKPELLTQDYYVEYDDQHHSGNWIAFHLLEHDVHHRADLFHYLHILGVEHPEVETP